MTRISPRVPNQADFDSLLAGGMPPVLARVYAARGIRSLQQLEYGLASLLPFERLKNATRMACLLADAIEAGRRLLIVADYDSDGATACAVAVRALRAFGAAVDYLVPNRFEYGYGLTPEIVQLAAASLPVRGGSRLPPLPSGERIEERGRPDILITVDNGIASVAGVAEARRLGMEVLVTDHHLPGDELPEAACIVNPNQPGCDFPSKNLAGVGVIFCVMLALRAELRARGTFAGKPEPNLAQLLDLVALGTVADVVKLDDNNRILVSQGLKRIRADRACSGIRALMRVAGRDPRRASTWDLGFALGPRLNAAGRLDDMSLGIECLLADDETCALELAQRLDALNRERRAIEADMLDSAESILAGIPTPDSGLKTQDSGLRTQDSYTLTLYDPTWHQGVIGILASRLKDRFHRPAITFAKSGEGELKGSGRSIPGLHLRDALDLVAKRRPDILQKFGGHAMAAGLTIEEADFADFAAAFEEVARELLTPAMLTKEIETDGPLEAAEISLELARLLREQVWGQGFAEPGFHGEFAVESQRVVGEKHLKLKLRAGGRGFDAMLFFHAEPLPERISAVYRLDVNEYNGAAGLQLLLSHWEAQ